MDCKEAEKAIPYFMEDALENEELQNFVEHIEHCEECKEELSIQFLILEGMNRLEYGDVLDLTTELDTLIQKAEDKLKFRKGLQYFVYVMEMMVVVAIVIIAALVYFR